VAIVARKALIYLGEGILISPFVTEKTKIWEQMVENCIKVTAFYLVIVFSK